VWRRWRGRLRDGGRWRGRVSRSGPMSRTARFAMSFPRRIRASRWCLTLCMQVTLVCASFDDGTLETHTTMKMVIWASWNLPYLSLDCHKSFVCHKREYILKARSQQTPLLNPSRFRNSSEYNKHGAPLGFSQNITEASRWTQHSI
jgi:hypothetical protein